MNAMISNVTPMPTRRQPDAAMRVLLYAPDDRYLARLAGKLGDTCELHWEDSRDIAPALLQHQDGWTLLLLDYSSGNAAYSSDLARQLHLLQPDLPLVAVGVASTDQAASVLAAFRAGVRDFVDVDSAAEDLQATLQRIASQPGASRAPLPGTAAPLAMPARGRLVVLLGSRPGVGATTLATHLGSVLLQADPARAGQERCLLLDMAQPGGDAALYLDTTTAFHYDDALRNHSRVDATLVRSAFAHHRGGLAVLGPPAGSWAPAAEPGALLDRLRAVFPLVLCDLGGVPPQQLPTALLREADALWTITDQTLGASVALDLLLRELTSRGQRDARLQLLVNRYDEAHGMRAAQLAERFGMALLGTLPNRSRMLRACAAEGLMLSEQHAGDPYVRAVRALLRALDPALPPAPPPRAWQRLLHAFGGS